MASSIQLPGLLQLPDSPRRRLVETLHRYYQEAGRPTLRAIDEWISSREGLAASKETVRRMLVGITVPLRWDIAESAFLALCALAGRNPDARHDDGLTLRAAYRRQWQAALEAGWGAGTPDSNALNSTH
jgi:hypothetical protein